MKRIYKDILKAIIPSMLATLFTGFYIIVDGFFIGQKLGDIGLAAINVAWPIAAFIQALGVALGVACGILVKKHQTLQDEENVKKAYTNTLFILFVFVILCLSLYFIRNNILYLIGADSATILYASSYIKYYILGSIFQILGCAIIPILRNNNHFHKAAIILVISTAINFLLDYIFIIKLEMGLDGAALASMLSQAFAMIAGITLLVIYKQVSFNKELSIKTIGTILRKSVAPFILTFSAAVIIIFYNKFCFKYGGNNAIAAYTVVAYIIYLPQYISIGISDGIQPLLTEHQVLNDGKLKKYFYNTFLILGVLLLVLTIVFMLTKNTIGRLFNLNNDSIVFYNDAYFYFILSFIFVGIIRIYAGLFEATEQVVKADIIVLIEPLLTPFILLIFTNLFDIKGIWIGYLIIQFILALSSFTIKNIDIRISKKKTE